MSESLFAPLVADIKSTILQSDDVRLINMSALGGVILFARNFESVEQLQNLITEINSLRPEILVCVDQEGGRVQRFKSPFTILPTLRSIGLLALRERSLADEMAYSHAWLMASEQLSVGVDLSFAPVLDVDKYNSAVIGDRSFCADPELATQLALSYINGMHDAGMCVTGKHFPGHGSVKLDSHIALPTDLRRLDEIAADDMKPFEHLSNELDAVMPAHIKFENVDSSPVGFSKIWLREILRDKIGFKGVIFSDDLSMGAAAIAGDYCQRAIAALDAGCDAILVCNQPEEAMKVADFIKDYKHVPGKDAEKNKPLASMKLKPANWGIGLSSLQSTIEWKQHSKMLSRL